VHAILLTDLRQAGLLDMDDGAVYGSHFRGAQIRRPRGVAHGSGLGHTRRGAERTFDWLHWFKRPRIRCERRADLDRGLLELACSVHVHERDRTAGVPTSWPYLTSGGCTRRTAAMSGPKQSAWRD
jgi:hypothetical protein